LTVLEPGSTTARIATVAGRPIPVSRLDERIAELRRGPRGRHLPPDGTPGSADVRRWVARELVTEAVLLHEATTAGLAAAGQPLSAMTGPMIAELVTRVTRSVAVPETEIRGYYERNRDRYLRPEWRRILHVLRRDAASAARVAHELADSAAQAVPGAELRDLRRGELAGPFEDAVFRAAIGTVVGPLPSSHGWHVARVEVVVTESVVPYAEARPAIEADILAAARERAFAAWLDERRRDVAVVEPEFDDPASPLHGFPSHRH
jgi:[acyl-carrier-protein] S-malonyltransferase